MADKNPNRRRSVHFNFWASKEEADAIRKRMAETGVVSLARTFVRWQSTATT